MTQTVVRGPDTDLAGPKVCASLRSGAGRELAIKIKPEWVGPLLGIDPLGVESQVVDPSWWRRPYNRLMTPRRRPVAPKTLRVLMAAMSRRTARRERSPPRCALDTVRCRADRCRASGRLDVGLSDRHFRRHVRDSTGVPPKTHARLLRFVDAMRTADRSGDPVWADVAVSAGYFDQSHFIRDCAALAGTSPSALHAERRRQVIDDRAMSGLSNPD